MTNNRKIIDDNNSWNILRMSGSSNTPCGYCNGDRSYVLDIKNPVIDEQKPMNNIISTGEDHMNSQRDDESGCSNEQTLSYDFQNSSRAFNASFSRLQSFDYQKMIDCGWRRCGKLLYKPDNWNSCCPSIPIRLDTTEFKPSKRQRKAWQHFNQMLVNKDVHNSKHENQDCSMDSYYEKRPMAYTKSKKLRKVMGEKKKKSGTNNSLVKVMGIANQVMQKSNLLQVLEDFTFSILTQEKSNKNWDVSVERKLCQYIFVKNYFITSKNNQNCLSQYVSIADKKEKEIELECCIVTKICAALGGRSKGEVHSDTLATFVVQKLKKMCELNMINDRIMVVSVKAHEKSGQIKCFCKVRILAESLMDDSNPNTGDNVKIKLPNIKRNPTIENNQKNEGELLLAQLLDSKDSKVPSLSVRSVPSSISSQDMEVCRLYSKYQEIIHGDANPLDTYEIPSKIKDLKKKLTQEQKQHIQHFKQFLGVTPLPPIDGDFSTDDEGFDIHIPYGSYHQQYRLNGHLVAVGVVDILPNSLSSVYSFYDPVLSKVLQLGTITALREIEWVKRASVFRPELKYYYLGFYIHSCPKMRYKAEYKPSSLLCPKHNVWIDFEHAKKTIERDSPIKHCCALVTPAKADKHNNRIHSSPSSILESIKLSFSLHESNDRRRRRSIDTEDMDDSMEVDGYSEDESVQDDVDLENLLTVADLSPQGRKVIDSHVINFITEVGIDISQRSIIVV